MKKLIEKDWTTKSLLRAVVVFNQHSGSRCGYVFIPKTHEHYVEPTYRDLVFGERTLTVMEYDKMYPHVEVHGGPTYGRTMEDDDQFPAWETRDGVWIGFDAAHLDDAKDFDVWKTLIENEADELLISTIIDVENQFPLTHDKSVIRDRDYMIEQCEYLATQLNIGDIANDGAWDAVDADPNAQPDSPTGTITDEED